MPRQVDLEEEFEALTGEPDPQRAAVFAEEILAKKWSELEELVEHAEYVLFPEKLYKRKKTGEFEAIKVMVRVPRKHEMRKARVLARRIAAEDDIDEKLDRDLFDDLETICIMSLCVRNVKAPYEPLHPDPRDFDKLYDTVSTVHLWGKLDRYRELLNPRATKLGVNEVVALIGAIAERRDIRPLHAIDGHEQASFIVSMACLLKRWMMELSSSPSSETSTPAASASAS